MLAESSGFILLVPRPAFAAPRHLGSRDRYIGRSAEALRRNIRFLAYNTRLLVLPWLRVPHPASHILGRIAATLSDDWQAMYHALREMAFSRA